MRCLMNQHFSFILAQTLSLFFVCELGAQITGIPSSNNAVISDALKPVVIQEQTNTTAILPLSPLVFAQEVNLRDKLTPLLSCLGHNELQKLSPEILDYLNRIASIEVIVASYLLVLTLKSIIHCQISQPVPTRSPYSSLDTYETNATTAQDLTMNDVEQKISIAEIIDLLEHVQQDLARIEELDRHDKKEIMNILLDRQQQLQRKLKQLGILHYSSQSSLWNSSLPWAVAGLFLGLTILTVALASIDSDTAQTTVQFPSVDLLAKNLGYRQQPAPVPVPDPAV
jgi:hypothetical protein